MWIMVVASHAARKDAHRRAKESTKGRVKAKGDVPADVFCVRALAGLVTVLHIMVETASAPPCLASDP